MITSSAKTALTAYAKKIVAIDKASNDIFLIEDDEALSYKEKEALLKAAQNASDAISKKAEQHFSQKMPTIVSFNEEEYSYLKAKLETLITETEGVCEESVFYCVGDADVDKQTYLNKSFWYNR